ncbi:MAG: hypothetical protein JRH20_32715 [Deltaproteobacteria bacterium]|nr:hypothetical protein [Deltaproteobacteria bacterium]
MRSGWHRKGVTGYVLGTALLLMFGIGVGLANPWMQGSGSNTMFTVGTDAPPAPDENDPLNGGLNGKYNKLPPDGEGNIAVSFSAYMCCNGSWPCPPEETVGVAYHFTYTVNYPGGSVLSTVDGFSCAGSCCGFTITAHEVDGEWGGDVTSVVLSGIGVKCICCDGEEQDWWYSSLIFEDYEQDPLTLAQKLP